MTGDHLFCQSSEDQIRGDKFKFPTEEAGLEPREPSPLERFCQIHTPTHKNDVSDELEGPFWPSRPVVLNGDFPREAHSLFLWILYGGCLVSG